MGKRKSIGLPGGPNEYITHVSQVFSTDGYKRNSPDVNNPFNIINSGNITMEDVDFPIIGIDNLGNSQIMMPGGEYEFPGDKVFELPMAQDGDETWGEWAKRKALRAINPLAPVDDLLQVMSIPSNIIREITEGVSGIPGVGDEGAYGDGKFNWGNIIPDLENTSILDETPTQVPMSKVLGTEGFGKSMVVDMITDPSSYIGAGILKNVIKKGATSGGPKILKSVTPQLNKLSDDAVEMVEDLFGNQIKKSNAVRLNRVEDANVTNTTFSKPNPDGTMPYETGNWFGSTIEPLYLNMTKKAGTSNILNQHSNKRLLTTYLNPEDAKNFNILNLDPSTTAYQLSGGRGNLPIPTEYVIPPSLVSRLRDKGKVGQATEIMEGLQDFYKMYGGDLPKAQAGFFKNIIKQGAKKLDEFIPIIQRKLRTIEKDTGLYSKDNLIKQVDVPGTGVKIEQPTMLAKFLDGIGFNKLTGRNSYLPHWARRDGDNVVARTNMPGAWSFDNKGMELLYNPSGNYYHIPDAFINNPLTAGRTFKALEDFIPKGSILKQGPEGSLSTDSFKLMMNRLGRGRYSDITDYSDPNVLRSFNVYGKGPKGTISPDATNFLENSMFGLQRRGLVGEGFTGFDAGIPNLTIRKNFTEGGPLKIMNDGTLEMLTYPSSVFKDDEGNPEQTVMLDPVDLGVIKGPIALAKEQMEKDGITDELKKGYVEGKSEKAYNNIIPQGYGNIETNLDRYRRLAQNIGRDPDGLWYDGPKDNKNLYTIPNREDAFRLYLGMPQVNNSFGVSDYRPGDSEDKSMVYLKPNYFNEDPIRQALVDQYFKELDVDEDENLKELVDKKTIGNERGLPRGKYQGDGTAWPEADNSLGDFTFDMGEDEKGTYISIYDIWDLNPFQQGEGSSVNKSAEKLLSWFNTQSDKKATSESEVSALFGAGKPFEVYERIYIDPKTKKILPQAHCGGMIKRLPKKEMGGKLRLYKDYINGVYDKSPSRDYVEKVYDKLNRVYLSQAKQANMSTPNYIMSYLVDE